jgi:hypothetical protein
MRPGNQFSDCPLPAPLVRSILPSLSALRLGTHRARGHDEAVSAEHTASPEGGRGGAKDESKTSKKSIATPGFTRGLVSNIIYPSERENCEPRRARGKGGFIKMGLDEEER